MMVKEALASWKGKAVKATMDEEIRSLIANGTWELVERLRGVNIMKNRWVLTTKYHIDDTVARKKARLVVKGFMQVYGANYDETYADKLRRHFIDEEQTGRIPKTPVTVNAYAELTSDGEDAQGRLAAVCGDDDEAGHRLRVRQAGKRPDGAE
ncbi:unnamed protein product [Closterium sp. NIES-54]